MSEASDLPPRMPVNDLVDAFTGALNAADADAGITAAVLTIVRCDGQAATVVRGFCTPTGFADHAQFAADMLREHADGKGAIQEQAVAIDSPADGLLVVGGDSAQIVGACGNPFQRN